MSEPVKLLEGFLSPEKCFALIEAYKDKVVSSTVVDNNTKQNVKDTTRTSSTYFIPDSDPIIGELKEKVAAFLKIDKKQIEGIQFLRYLHGERYLYHHDYLPGNPPNQRVHTIILYLNDLVDGDGGETAFFHYKMKVKPKVGMAVWFRNMTEDGKPINESLHSGEPILREGVVKYALNIWTRVENLCK